MTTPFLRPCIIYARANSVIVEKTRQAAYNTFLQSAINSKDKPKEFEVCGALEIPLALKQCALTTNFNCFVVLGAVIKGQSDHYDHVCRMANDGVMKVALEHNLALGNGILTVHSFEQALQRAGGPVGNIGQDAALAALNLYETFLQLNTEQRNLL